jgi:RimJ/RimL family protein N-acetyltransferase
MTTAMPVLATPRLIVRPFGLDDLAACHQLFDHEAWETGLTLAERREWLAWVVSNYTALARLFQPPYGDRAIVLRATDEVVGSVGLVPALGPFDRLPSFAGRPAADNFSPQVGLFWAMRTGHRRQGYAAEAAQAVSDYAFQVLQLGRLVAMTDYENAASQAVMRRLGMTLEHNPRPEPAWFQVVGVLKKTR